MAAPAWAAEEASGLPPAMWERIRAVQPDAIDLTPTQSPAPPETLSLRQCVSLAFQHNRSFRAAQEGLLSARRGLWVADQRLSYSVSGSAQRDDASGTSATSTASASASASWERLGGDSVALGVSTGSKSSFSDLLTERPSMSLTYDRPILRGVGLASSTYESVRGARFSLVREEFQFYETRQDLALRIIGLYFSAVRAQGDVEISQRAVERAKDFYEKNYALFTGEGVKEPDEVWVSEVAEVEVDQARLSWDQAKQSVIQEEQGFRDAMDDLLLTMGLLPGSTPELTTMVGYAPKDYEEAALTETALANSLTLAGLNLSREDARARRRIAYSSAKPDLTASLGVTDAGATRADEDGSTSWFAGLRVDVPLWDRSRAESKASADRSLLLVEQETIAARVSEAQRIRTLVRANESAKATIALGEQNVALAQKNRDRIQAMFEEQVAGYDYLKVQRADEDLVSAERALLQQKVDYFLTTVKMRQALGEDITLGLPE